MTAEKDSLLPILDNIHGKMSDQVKFAEAKNILLATFSGTAGAALLTTYSIRSANIPLAAGWLTLLASVIMFAGVLICFVSFRPKMTNKLANSDKSLTGVPNLYFFGDLAALNEDDLLERLATAASTEEPRKTLHLQLANQIIVNSQIAKRKHSLFQKALNVVTAGVLLAQCSLIFEAFNGKNILRATQAGTTTPTAKN